MKITRRQLRRIIKEIRSPDDNERSETFKLIKLFLSDGGSMQAMELGEMLPDVDKDILDAMSIIESRVEEIIQVGRGDFPDHWNPGGGRSVREANDSEWLYPFRPLLQKLRDFARAEIDGPGHDAEFQDIGKGTTDLYQEIQYTIYAINSVITAEYTPEELSKGQGDGKYFVALAERFGLDYEPIA